MGVTNVSYRCLAILKVGQLNLLVPFLGSQEKGEKTIKKHK